MDLNYIVMLVPFVWLTIYLIAAVIMKRLVP